MALREVRHRPASALLLLLGIAVPAAFATALLLTSGLHARGTKQSLWAKENETAGRMRAMRREYEHIGRRMGHDVAVVAAGARVDKIRTRGFASETMPAAVADTLIASRPGGIDHVLPRLGGLIHWPERGTKIALVGLGHEHVFDDTLDSTPFVKPLPAGFARVGHQLAHDLELSAGQTIEIRGRRLTVAECFEERGSLDDMSVWAPLEQAQRILGADGRISDVLALTAPVDSGDRVTAFERSLEGVIGSVRILPLNLTVRTRKRMLDAAGGVSTDLIAMERAHHETLNADRARSLGMLLAVAAACCAVWVATVSFVNTYRRRREIGVLRTVGWPLSRIIVLFVWKGLVIGIPGAFVGVGTGLASTYAWTTRGAIAACDCAPLTLVAGTALLVGLAACVLPAAMAAARNPASLVVEHS